MTEQTIQANHNPLVDNVKHVFRFKKDKLGNKRPDLELEIPQLSVEGIVDVLTRGDKKEVELLLESLTDTYRSHLAGFVADNENLTQATLPLDQVTWAAIANLDKKDRRSTKIEDEKWVAFGQDFVTVMKVATPSRTEEQLNTAVKVFLAKFSMFKTDKNILNKLKTQLGIYMENTKSEEEFSDILELLLRRLDNYLAADDTAALAAALG